MSVTLEELLESSGISSPKGDGQEKTASDNAQEDIVSALRKMAEAKPTQEDTKKLAAQELAEKTAEIAVIAQTLSEIEKVASLGSRKEPKGHQKLATFIKVAIDKGYSEEEIAGFLKEAIFQRMGRAAKSAIQSVSRPVQRAALKVDEVIGGSETRLLRDKLIHGSEKEVTKHLKVLSAQYGPKEMVKALLEVKKEGVKLPYAAQKFIPRDINKPSLKFVLPGGAQKSVKIEDVKRYGIPGAAAAGGVALGSRKKDKDGKSGVTVVRN
jgi:hypothetical protein